MHVDSSLRVRTHAGKALINNAQETVVRSVVERERGVGLSQPTTRIVLRPTEHRGEVLLAVQLQAWAINLIEETPEHRVNGEPSREFVDERADAVGTTQLLKNRHQRPFLT